MLARRTACFAFTACVLGLVFLPGCQSHSYSPSRYVSPRVVGRVVDSRSHEPLEGVQVTRLVANESYQIEHPPKGGKQLENPPPIRTGADGTFILDSQRELMFLRRQGWYAVTVAFELTGYERFVGYWTTANSTNAPDGEPVVAAGDILMLRLAK